MAGSITSTSAALSVARRLFRSSASSSLSGASDTTSSLFSLSDEEEINEWNGHMVHDDHDGGGGLVMLCYFILN